MTMGLLDLSSTARDVLKGIAGALFGWLAWRKAKRSGAVDERRRLAKEFAKDGDGEAVGKIVTGQDK